MAEAVAPTAPDPERGEDSEAEEDAEDSADVVDEAEASRPRPTSSPAFIIIKTIRKLFVVIIKI